MDHFQEFMFDTQLSVDFQCRLIFTCVRVLNLRSEIIKIEAMHLLVQAQHFLACLYFIYVIKIYVR